MTTTASAVFVIVMTTLVFAVVPWVIAQNVTTHNPRFQATAERNRYQTRSAAAALLLSALILPTAGLSWMAALAAAIYLNVHWRRYSKTQSGRRALEAARFWADFEATR